MLHAREDYNGRIVDLAGKVGPDEPVFLLRAQDKHFVPAVLAYLQIILASGEYDYRFPDLILEHARRARAWQAHWPNVKAPDLPPEPIPGEPARSVAVDGEPLERLLDGALIEQQGRGVFVTVAGRRYKVSGELATQLGEKLKDIGYQLCHAALQADRAG